MLCSNRPEGFGPHSSLSSPVPTACFVDVVLVPLPIWIALALLPALVILAARHRQLSYLQSTSHRSWPYRVVAALYYILIVCNVLMQTLEIVRLSLIHFGIGLLPFSYVGLLLGAALHRTRGAGGKVWAWQAFNLVVWLGGVVMSVVKVAGLAREHIPRKGSKYPMSDQILDVAVIAGVYAVVAILEVILGVWRSKTSTGVGVHRK